MRYLMLALAMILGVTTLALAEETPTTAPAGGKEEKIEASAVPQKVMDAFKKDFPGAKIIEIEKETGDAGAVTYEFEFTDKDGQKQEASYDANGKRLEDDDDKD